MKNGNRSAGTVGLLYILPGMAGLALFFLIPFVQSLRYLFTSGVGAQRFVGLHNFKDLATNPAFLLALKNTALFIAVSVPLLLALSLVLALRLRTVKSRLVQSVLLAPMIVPVASALMGYSVIFGVEGILPQLLKTGSMLEAPFVRVVLILIFLIKNVGYMTMILSGAVDALPAEYQEAFALDSDSELRFSTKIVIPLISPVLFFVAILSVVNSFQIFREIYGLFGDYPPQSLYMLQNFMNNNFYKLNYSRLCTASFLVTMAVALIAGLYLYMQRRTEKE